MSLWLDKTKELIIDAGINLNEVSYNSIVVVFHDHLSNRNLAILIASLYQAEENDIYFEIDKIISNYHFQDIDEIRKVKELLNDNKFQDWVDSDEF